MHSFWIFLMFFVALIIMIVVPDPLPLVDEIALTIGSVVYAIKTVKEV